MRARARGEMGAMMMLELARRGTTTTNETGWGRGSRMTTARFVARMRTRTRERTRTETRGREPYARERAFGAFAFGGVTASEGTCDAKAEEAAAAAARRGAEANAPTSNASTAQWRIYTDIGRGLVREGKVDEARKYLERALVEAKRGFGEDDAHVAAALNNLAELRRIESRWEESERMFGEALKILRNAYGENHPAVGTALHNLAGCRLAQNDVDGAFALYAESLARKEATLGTNHPEYATTLYHMAEVLCRNERKEDAVVVLERSIRVSEEIGAAHTDAYLKRMKRLAQLLFECERYEDAERVRRRILSNLEDMHGEEHVTIAGACESLALVLTELDRLDEAGRLLERSTKILSRLRGDGAALALASARLNLGEIAEKRSNTDEAITFARLALDVLSPSALDAIRRDDLRDDVRVGVVVQHARAAALLRRLAPHDPRARHHAHTAAQNLSAVSSIAEKSGGAIQTRVRDAARALEVSSRNE